MKGGMHEHRQPVMFFNTQSGRNSDNRNTLQMSLYEKNGSSMPDASENMDPALSSEVHIWQVRCENGEWDQSP